VGYLIWIDLEMTGLDPETHVILEIASIVTDNRLEILQEGPDLAIKHPDHILRSADEWSRRQHLDSGLLEKAANSPYDCRRAEKETVKFLEPYLKGGASPLCGNSVWQDRRFLIKHMPKLEALFHYRIIDVSSVKELVKRWYPHLALFKKRKSHLAMNDIKESIEELKYYRNNVFI
jgi:oligoribonuclease